MFKINFMNNLDMAFEAAALVVTSSLKYVI